MSSAAPLDTLFYPFDTGALDIPAGRTLFLHAQAHPSLEKFIAPDCVQHFYPDAVHLSGVIDNPAPPYQAALILIPKDKTEAQGDLARALDILAPGGLLVAAAANEANGNRLEGWFKEMGLTPHSAPKNKARAVWAIKDNQAPPPAWLEAAQPLKITLDGELYWTQAGLFGWDKIDVGSALLAQHIPEELKGSGADFGCGYGYLTRQIKSRPLTVVDADKRALDCCLKNNPGVTGVWSDLTRPWSGEPFDWIVMNPPFHAGKKTDVEAGAAFIKTAAGALKKGGMLYMVANRQLPYEKFVTKHFTKVDIAAQDKGFKVLIAKK